MNTSPRERTASRAGTRTPRNRPVRDEAVGMRWPRWLPLAVMGVVTAVVVVLYFTPLLGVRSVRVEGGTLLPEQQVVAAAQVELGRPMLQVDTDEVAARLRALPKMASAEAELAWPSTVLLRVTERAPAVFMKAADGIYLVDDAGVPFQKVPEPPAGVPELRVATASVQDPATRAALTVLRSLGPPLRGEVLTVVADKPSDIHLLLTGNREVQWGDVDDAQRKAAILPPLLTRPGKVYDVTSPVLPTVS